MKKLIMLEPGEKIEDALDSGYGGIVLVIDNYGDMLYPEGTPLPVESASLRTVADMMATGQAYQPGLDVDIEALERKYRDVVGDEEDET